MRLEDIVDIVKSTRFKAGVAMAGLTALGMAVVSSCYGCDNNEQAKATPTPPTTTAVTYTPTQTPNYTPMPTITTPTVLETPIPGYNCPGVTLDHITQTGQTDKLTAPFSGCVDAEWVAVPMGSPPKDMDEAIQKLWDGRIAYTIPQNTEIMMPIDGVIKMSAATEKGVLGIGGYTCQIVSGNYSVLITMFNAELNFDKNNTFLSRGTGIGKSGSALPSKFDLGKSNLLLGFFAEPTAQQQGYKYDLSLPGFWVDEKVATSYLAAEK